MISSDFKPYILEITNFLKSISLKYRWVADQTNVMLVQNGYDVDLNDPTTWKYYLNLIGEYHESDTPMTVVSLDTLEEIAFTKDVLVEHPRTAASYKPGGSYFTTLCTRYPDQTELIKSILFPVADIHTAIDADDLTLLQWGSGYLEDAESPMLLAALVDFLAVYKERWNFTFLRVEDYFDPTNLGLLYAQMMNFLLAKRHEYINTPYVHSWHINNYLQSKGLDDYSDVLTREKQLFLYQNWDYLKINSGKQSNLIILIQNLLSDMGISIFGRRVMLESQTAAASCQLTPRFIPDNLLGSDSKLVDEIQSETVQEMQQRLYAMGVTPSGDDETVAVLTRTLGDTVRNNYLTKLLEIKPVQVDYRYQNLLDQFILDTLIKAITTGRYVGQVMITDPVNNAVYWVSTKEALALYDYCVRKSCGGTPDALPTEYVYIATLKDRPGTVDPSFFYNGYTYLTNTILNTKSFMGYWTWPVAIKSEAVFSSMLSEFWLLYLVKFQNVEYCSAGIIKRALQTCCAACFEHNTKTTFTLIPGFTTYSDWLNSAGVGFQRSIFDSYDQSKDMLSRYGNFADSILSSLFTATDSIRQYGNFSLSDSGYSRLRKLFMQLTSYTVRFLETNQDAQDYVYLGTFVLDDTQTDLTDPLNLALGLEFSEKTSVNCIETQSALANTLAISESDVITDDCSLEKATFSVVEEDVVSETMVNPMARLEMIESDVVEGVMPMSIGFDFSGFAP